MRTKLTFDENGFLKPYRRIETNLETLEKYFVEDFPNSRTRKIIFENYLKFLADLQYEIFPHFEQWIGGSFISKKENPNDIDVVTYLDYKVVDLRKRKIDKFWNFSLEDKFIDSYLVREYLQDDVEYDEFLEIKKSKHELYSTTRLNIPRGYLKLVFTK